MNDNNTENWENELKEKFSNHQEPTDAKDFDAFMDKLETNDFFEEKGGYRFPVKWIVLVGVLITGIILWIMNGEKQEEQIAPVHKSMKLIENQENQNTPNSESKELYSDHEKEKIVQEVETPKEPLIIQKADDKENNKEHEIKESTDDKSSVEVEKHIQKDSIKQSIAKEVIDTTIIQPKKEELKEEPKKVHTPKKYIVIMSTDTTIVTDTSHVKHRKKNRRRK